MVFIFVEKEFEIFFVKQVVLNLQFLSVQSIFSLYILDSIPTYSYMQNNLLRYQTGLETSESDTRKILGRPKKRPICMLLRLQQVEEPLDKYKGNREYHPLVKVCTAMTLTFMMKISITVTINFDKSFNCF